MREKIDTKSLKDMKPGDFLVDAEVRGFVARRLPSGVISFGCRYRDRKTGKRHWIRLGLHGEVTADQARNEARIYLGQVAARENPIAIKREKALRAAGKDTVGHLLDDFMKRYARGDRKLRSADEIEGIFKRLVKPAIGSKSLGDITRKQITKMLDDIADKHGPVMADRTLAHVRRAFAWQMVRDESFRSPIIRGMARTKPKERERKRALDDGEIRDVWAGVEGVNPVFRTLIRVLFLTGQRRNEIAHMRWEWINGKTLVIPAETYKTKVPHAVPLTPAVMGLLESLPRYEKCPFVFTTNGRSPYSGYSRTKAALDAKINLARKESGRDEMAPWVIHDIRRTARSRMSAAGVSSDVAERVLGHKIGGVRGVYDVYEYLDEKRDALVKLATAVERIIDPPADNVVDLAQARLG